MQLDNKLIIIFLILKHINFQFILLFNIIEQLIFDLYPNYRKKIKINCMQDTRMRQLYFKDLYFKQYHKTNVISKII